MQATPIILIAYLLAMAGGLAHAAPRSGELEVRESNSGIPCFTIPETEERQGGAPEFQSISVVEAGPGPKTLMWSMAVAKQRAFAVSFRMCIPYAGRLPVLPQRPAAALQPGRPYEVTIDARPPQGGGARQYRTRFCLVQQGEGPLRVRNIGPAGPGAKSRPSCAD